MKVAPGVLVDEKVVRKLNKISVGSALKLLIENGNFAVVKEEKKVKPAKNKKGSRTQATVNKKNFMHKTRLLALCLCFYMLGSEVNKPSRRHRFLFASECSVHSLFRRYFMLLA